LAKEFRFSDFRLWNWRLRAVPRTCKCLFRWFCEGRKFEPGALDTATVVLQTCWNRDLHLAIPQRLLSNHVFSPRILRVIGSESLCFAQSLRCLGTYFVIFPLSSLLPRWTQRWKPW
jgi:hypothetical protein